MKRRWLLFGAALGAALATGASRPRAEVVFKWANDGDVRAMDPYTLDETVQNSFLSNIYEPLVRRNRKLEVEPALATSWEQTSPTVWRFHLRQGVKWQDGSPFTVGDVLFSFKRITGKNSQLSPEVAAVKDIRKVDDATVDVETKAARPDPALRDDQPCRSCRRHGAPSTTRSRTSSSARATITRCAMRWAPARSASTLREADRRSVLGRTPAGGTSPSTTSTVPNSPSSATPPTRVAALLTGEVDMIYSVPTQDMERIAHTHGHQADPGAGAAHDLSRHGPGARRAAVLQCEGQEPVQGRARAPGVRARDRRGRDRAARDARQCAADLADVGAGRQRLQPGDEHAAEARSRQGQAAARRGRLSRTASRSRSTARTTATSTTRRSARRSAR